MPSNKATVSEAFDNASQIEEGGPIVPCPQSSHGETSKLEEISVLFIPFDAAQQHYKRNVQQGVTGFTVSTDESGRPVDPTKKKGMDPSRPLVPPGSSPNSYVEPRAIAAELPNIVRQECERIRNLHHPDSTLEERLRLLVESNRPGKTPADLSDLARSKLETSLKGYKDYPSVLFLSENPTGAEFPRKIDTGVPGKGYVRRYALDKSEVKGLPPVNEMAVYVREDMAERMTQSRGRKDALSMTVERVTRSTGNLAKGGKDEHMVKVTVSKGGGHSLTVAGVHLRSKLVGASKSVVQQELDALPRFCAENGIQTMVGDFNIDVQRSAQGSRGAYADSAPENQPRFLIPPASESTEARAEFTQQFSNSVGDDHFMGYFQADQSSMRVVGPGAYGLYGASGARSFDGGGDYYSDHPSVYFSAVSFQPTPTKRKQTSTDSEDLSASKRSKLAPSDGKQSSSSAPADTPLPKRARGSSGGEPSSG